MKTVNTLNLMLLLFLTTVGESGCSQVFGRTDESVTLGCYFDVQTRGEPSVCWNRGDVPSMECNNQLIATGVYKPRTETSSPNRYRLLGRLDDGDASLTILNLTETDAGRYGCRVRVPGWFNDQKHHIDLMVERGEKPGVITTASTTTQTGKNVATQTGRDVTTQTGSDATPTATIKRAAQEVTSLHMFVGNSLRLSFIVFIPALLMAVVYRVWKMSQSEESSTV